MPPPPRRSRQKLTIGRTCMLAKYSTSFRLVSAEFRQPSSSYTFPTRARTISQRSPWPSSQPCGPRRPCWPFAYAAILPSRGRCSMGLTLWYVTIQVPPPPLSEKKNTERFSKFRRWLGIDVSGIFIELVLWGMAAHLVWGIQLKTWKRILIICAFGARLLYATLFLWTFSRVVY